MNRASDSSPPPYAEAATAERVREILERLYVDAERAHATQDFKTLQGLLGQKLFEQAWRLGEAKHAARGVALTLCAYKVASPKQDIRAHKSDHAGGFSARSIDSAVTVPFLAGKSLPYNVETHWLSQTFSFAGPYVRDIVLKTSPRDAGPLMVEVVNCVQESPHPTECGAAVVGLLLSRLIDERNKGRVELTKPKGLGIEDVIDLISRHFAQRYDRNAPRLPQLVIYSLYRCIVGSVDRYKPLQLQPLERLKTANRKSGTVGDVDVTLDGRPVEAVEIKFGVPVDRKQVAEAIQKIKAASVERYFILSTAGIADGEAEDIQRLQKDFRRSNGCEIVVNGVLETLRYYLRLLKSTNDFVFQYTALLETDPDIDYQHRLAWNEVCAKL